jgi:hypothetical protein
MLSRSQILAVFILLLPITPSRAATVSIHVVDGSVADLQNELVIVRSLHGYRESLRALTNAQGRAPICELKAGVYQLIVSEPYGLWKTHIEEFIVGETSLKIDVSMEVLPTHGIGDLEVIAPEVDLVLVDTRGEPLSEVQVFVRDGEAQYGQWYRANSDGRVTVHTFGDGSVFLVSHAGKLTQHRYKMTDDETKRIRESFEHCPQKQTTRMSTRTVVIHLN